MVTHSSILVLRIQWTEEPGVHGVTKNWTNTFTFTTLISRGIGIQIQVIPTAKPKLWLEGQENADLLFVLGLRCYFWPF